MPVDTDHLLPDEVLGPDQYLSAGNGRYALTYQGDGNLVLYKNYRNRDRRALWGSATNGSAVSACTMHADGNLVIGPGVGPAVWESGTWGNPGCRLVVQDDGNVVIYRPDDTPVWATNTVQAALPPAGPQARGDDMQPGECLYPGQAITSANWRYTLMLQTDGNLVLYRRLAGVPWRSLWASGTAYRPVDQCLMQSDGNLVIDDGDGQATWDSGTWGNQDCRLVVQDDGNVVIYRPDGTPIWATNTVQPPISSTISWPWAVVLCQFNDLPAVPQQVDYYVDLFTRNGTGGVADYWRAVSCNALDLTQSPVFGWFTMSHSSAEVSQLHFPNDRSVLLQWGIDSATANGIDLSEFRSVLVVQNFGVDHGVAGNGVVIVHQDPTLCEFGFICHEMGHGFGLPHSYAANPDWEYGDGWDVMSFATTTFQFPISFRGTQGMATVGVNARNLDALGAVPERRVWVPAQPDFSEQITLDPLNQPPIGNNGYLLGVIPPDTTKPARPTNSSFTVEYRRRQGWDRSIPRDAVSIHEVKASGFSYLQPTAGGNFVLGQQFVTPDPQVFVRVVGMDPASGTATLRVWDIPEGSLRKEDSKPRVYLMENGTKRWVTSPQVLFALGKTWADVHVVPDGGLDGLPIGQDVT